VFTPVLAKHSRSFSTIRRLAVGVDRMRRNFEPTRKQVETWQRSELTDVTVKVVIYEAFIEGKLEAAKHLARSVHDLYFEPKYDGSSCERSGASRMRLPPPSKNWTQSPSSRRQRNSGSFLSPGSHNRSRRVAASWPAVPLRIKVVSMRIEPIPFAGRHFWAQVKHSVGTNSTSQLHISCRVAFELNGEDRCVPLCSGHRRQVQPSISPV